jgi:hypothetical protein
VKSTLSRIVLAPLALPLALVAPSFAAPPERGGTGRAATPPWVQQGQTPLQKRIRQALAEQSAQGRPTPKVEFHVGNIEYVTNVKTARQATQDPGAPTPRGERRAIRAVTRIDYAGPEQAGLAEWPPMKVRRKGDPNDVLDFSAQYHDLLARKFPPDPKTSWPGFWEVYRPGHEPRTYELTETIVYTTPEDPGASPSPADVATSSATSQESILMGFSYLGPAMDYTISDSLYVLGVQVYDFTAGFALDWALGLRLPGQARADAVTEPMVAGQSYSASSRLDGTDWTPGDYSGWGVAPENGNEFVLRFHFFVGVHAELVYVDICPGCSVEVNVDKSTSFATPFGSGSALSFPPVTIPAYGWDLWALAFEVGAVFTPHITPEGIAVDWEAAPGSAASGSGSFTYGEPGTDYEFGELQACLTGPSHDATVRLRNFRYQMGEFSIDVGAYLNLEIFDQGVWNPTWPLVSIGLGDLGGSLGQHKQCDVLLDCEPVGPPNVVDLTIPVVDLDAPETSITVAGTPGTEGWFTSDVVAILSAHDHPDGCGIGVKQTEYAAGGPYQTYSGPFTLSTEGVTDIAYRSTDNDGNVEPEHHQIVKLDKTPPVITGAPTTPANAYGWYNTSVVVHFEASDPISGVASVSPDQTLASEGAGQSVTGHATDRAGNSSSTVVGGINIDGTAPVVAISSPQSRSYENTDSLTISWTAFDGLSGIAGTQGALDGVTVANGAAVDLLLLGAGPHTVVASAVDRADNAGRAQVTFAVDVDIDGLIAAKEHACALGWIDSAGVCNSLDAKLRAAKKSIERGASGTAINQLNAFLNELEAQKGKHVSAAAYELLSVDATFVRDHLV